MNRRNVLRPKGGLPPSKLLAAGRKVEAAARAAHAKLKPPKFAAAAAVGAALGISPASWDRLTRVGRAATSDPEAYGDLLALMDRTSISRAWNELRRREKAEKAKAATAQAAQPPQR